MGIIYNEDAPMETVCEAYGICLKARWNRYDSNFSREVQKAAVEVEVNGRRVYLGNLCIFDTILEREKEMICYWMSKKLDEMDDYSLEKFFQKDVFGCLWRSRAEAMRFKEKSA